MARELAAVRLASSARPWSAAAAAARPSTSWRCARPSRAPARAPRQVVFERSLASAITASALEQQPKPLLIGERVNTQGSRAFKQVMLADDYDGAVAIARDQVEGGAHALDVCVALTERADEADMMATLVKRLAMGVEMPLVFDSTDAAVIARALETYPGRALDQLDQHGERPRADRRRRARTPSATAPPASRSRSTRRGWPRRPSASSPSRGGSTTSAWASSAWLPGDLIFDTLTFTLATGQEEFRRSAIETIEGIRAVKRELPGAWTVLGVSNVSFGLSPPARAVLNSVFLHHAIDAGLDAAIVNPAHVRPIYEISGAGARAGRRPDLRPPPGRARALHRPFRPDRDGRPRRRRIRSRASPPTSASTRRSCTAPARGSRTTSTWPSTSAAAATTTGRSTC